MTIKNQSFSKHLNGSNQDSPEFVKINFDTFKLESREIGKVRSLIQNAYSRNEQILEEIEFYKAKIKNYERGLSHCSKCLAELTKEYASRNPMTKVA